MAKKQPSSDKYLSIFLCEVSGRTVSTQELCEIRQADLSSSESKVIQTLLQDLSPEESKGKVAVWCGSRPSRVRGVKARRKKNGSK